MYIGLIRELSINKLPTPLKNVEHILKQLNEIIKKLGETKTTLDFYEDESVGEIVRFIDNIKSYKKELENFKKDIKFKFTPINATIKSKEKSKQLNYYEFKYKFKGEDDKNIQTRTQVFNNKVDINKWLKRQALRREIECGYYVEPILIDFKIVKSIDK